MSFATLPLELQERILREALGAGSGLRFSLQSSVIDTNQGLVLAEVSPTCRAIITGWLYRSIRVTTPSFLRQLAATLAQRPDLANIVTSIHIGAESELPMEGWPFLVGNERGMEPWLYLKSTLSDKDEAEGRLPQWCKPGEDFNLRQPKATCAAHAIDRGMEAALVMLDVEPWRRGYSFTELKIGLRAWASRLILLQAMLDLYLVEMRRIEDTKGYEVVSWRVAEPGGRPISQLPAECKSGLCNHYPELDPFPWNWEQFPTLPLEKRERRCIITGAQLWDHLSRPGGPADHFDHLLLLTRSMPEALNMTPREWHLVRSDLAGPHYTMFTNEEWLDMHGTDEDLEEFYSRYDDCDEEDWEEPKSEASDEEEWAYKNFASTADRVEELLEIGGSILSRLPNLSNVSVTSFFHRALPSLKHPERVQNLSIGPKSRHWNDVFPDNLVDKLPNVKELRICGLISSKDATQIAWGFPRLETLLWSASEDTRTSAYRSPLSSACWLLLLTLRLTFRPFRTLDVIARLQAQRDQPPPPASSSSPSQPKHKKQKSSKGNQKPKTRPQPQRAERTIEIRLHPDSVRNVLARAPSQEVGSAWAAGTPVEGTLHAVRVVKTPILTVSDSPLWSDDERMLVKQYAEGRRWWEEGAGLRGGMGG